MLEELAEQVISLGMVAGIVCYLEVMEGAGRLGPQLCTIQSTIKHKLIVKSTIKANIIFFCIYFLVTDLLQGYNIIIILISNLEPLSDLL
jgi:hypothetical protein